MKPFGYWRDPLALGAIALYALNRWGLKPHFPHGFLHDQFNDVLLIPAALPLLLWVQHRLGWRPHHEPPRLAEFVLPLFGWTIICEGLGPFVLGLGTADVWDVVAYLAGAVLAGCWWRWWYRAPVASIENAGRA